MTADELLSQEGPEAEGEREQEPQGQPYPPRPPAYIISPKTREWLDRGLKMVILVRCTVIGLIFIAAGGAILVITLRALESMPDMGYAGNKMMEDTLGLTSPVGLGAIFMIVVGVISIAAGIVVTVILSRREKARRGQDDQQEK